MKVSIVGAGAIGGMLAAVLKMAGHEPTLIARGRTLENLQQHGVTFVEKETREHMHIHATDDPASLGPQDLVVIAMKAHQIEAGLLNIMPLIGPETSVMTAINGIPWWFFQGWGDRNEILRPVDPNGALFNAFDPKRVIGCAVYLAAHVDDPFTVVSVGPRKLMLGSVTGDQTDAVQTVAGVFTDAGVAGIVASDIRAEVMNKLMGNLWANPISVITRGTMSDLCNDPGILKIARFMMEEFEELCAALEIKLPLSIEKRLEGAASLGDFRTSMLQDADRGRAIELEAILGGVIAAAEKVGTPCPTMRLVYGLVRAHARSHDLLSV